MNSFYFDGHSPMRVLHDVEAGERYGIVLYSLHNPNAIFNIKHNLSRNNVGTVLGTLAKLNYSMAIVIPQSVINDKVKVSYELNRRRTT